MTAVFAFSALSAPLGRFWAAFWRPLGSEGGAKITHLTCPLVTLINIIFVATLDIENEFGFDSEIPNEKNKLNQ